MSSVESVAPVQPAVIKDVQTLKANLKEQEKRARSENEVEDVVSITDQVEPLAEQDTNGEQRKRRKVSNPVVPAKESQELAFDDPLPSTKSIEPIEPSNGLTSASTNGAPAIEKDAVSAAPTPPSPTKTTGSVHPRPAEAIAQDAKSTTPVDDKNDQAEPVVVPLISEVANHPVTSNDECEAHKIDQAEKTSAEIEQPEATKEAVEALLTVKETAAPENTLSTEAVTVAA
ncbi:hypothetical protein MJO28_010817 [Puccinia striiformis f. sp. tritici]|uniref:Uncharacterized protein n=4 Tax=Puccinia striiformis TaxID=27350 RepID=A0A0L0W1J9_9BASI|nr:hypothetical protein Pst134EA_019628 [Puccinia striiformis f. sp. tritici]KAI9610497.1 hypothetical protein H4Q26_006639 [Puccinia striiformis f. sp. tritici PST-130]KNF05386.1 hypothetical protein PSTG_01599 [Puccinia striiformis f. sp. tritici PST-78]POW04196.1 hypothetical protein PSHT_11400 [Puccinia striiformis]KAH9449722.1 hypothetical protein Pst134EB_020537 [Puccinia striiformis f. sp. tritici]KAH9459475.1 hypothetical protein Pst134EA_019628 [Puccinia striiformis f. sp. tritici]